jgi:formylglycine-generating enzyme required for sulfatase activity
VVVVLLIVYRRPMVSVPAGVFKMGSTDDEIDYALELCNIHYGDCERRWFENEQPSHTVALDGFWIGRTEVTNAQFAAFLNDQGNGTEGGMTWLAVEDEDCRIEQKGDEFQPKDGYADHPVIEVTWYGAAAYCGWAGARLPTEAEWEYAARRWEGRIFPWGNRFDGTKLNYCDASCVYDWKDTDYNDGYERTAPVRSLRAGASWCGAFDMAGNVWEWVADWYGDYPYGPQDNPTGPLSGEDRVRRGGSWDNQPDNLRSAARNHSSPDYHYNTIGFRCARDSQ